MHSRYEVPLAFVGGGDKIMHFRVIFYNGMRQTSCTCDCFEMSYVFPLTKSLRYVTHLAHRCHIVSTLHKKVKDIIYPQLICVVDICYTCTYSIYELHKN